MRSRSSDGRCECLLGPKIWVAWRRSKSHQNDWCSILCRLATRFYQVFLYSLFERLRLLRKQRDARQLQWLDLVGHAVRGQFLLGSWCSDGWTLNPCRQTTVGCGSGMVPRKYGFCLGNGNPAEREEFGERGGGKDEGIWREVSINLNFSVNFIKIICYKDWKCILQ